MSELEELCWRAVAESVARDAHAGRSRSRRGSYRLLGDGEGVEDILVVHDSHPYKAGPQYRDRPLARFRQKIDQLGLLEKGFGTWPPEGEKRAGYTFALLLVPYSEEIQRKVNRAYLEEVVRTARELKKG